MFKMESPHPVSLLLNHPLPARRGEGWGEGGDFRNDTGEFMAEDGGGHYHFGVITAFENLQIRAASKRGLDADADFARLERGRRNVLNLNFFPAVQDGGFHAGSL